MVDRPEVLFPFLGSQLGGSHMSTLGLAEGLRELGTDVRFLAAADTAIAAEALRRGFRVLPTGEPPSGRLTPWRDLARFGSRRRLLKPFAPGAVVHCNDIGVLQGWGLVAKTLGMPVVYHNRALNRMTPPNTTLLRAADQVICISQGCRDAVAFLPERKVRTILNPIGVAAVDRDVARTALAAEFGFEPRQRFVGFVGNFWRRKRPHFALEAFRRMAAERPDLACVFFGRRGDYDVEDLKRAAAELGLEGRVVFAGFRLPLERNIAALDLLLLPAVKEPFGRTLIEAALLGTPYVATDEAGHHEIGSRWKGGRLVARDATADAFGAACLEVLRRPETVALTPAQREALARDFALSTHAEAVRRCYREAFGRGGVPARVGVPATGVDSDRGVVPLADRREVA